MKNTIKTVCAFLLCAIIFLCLNANFFAYISCDGNVNMYEWKSAEDITLFRPHDRTGCCYSSASAKVKYIEEDRRVYLAVFIDNGDRRDFNGKETKMIVSFNESSEIIFNSVPTAEYDKNEFVVRYGYSPDETGGGSYETDIVLKDVPYEDELTINITLVDYLSNISQTFKIDIKSEELKEEESRSVAQSEKDAENNKNNAKTTKEKTTKPKKETTVLKTAVITEDFVSYSESLNKSNTTIITIGAVCTVASVGALLAVLFKKK